MHIKKIALLLGAALLVAAPHARAEEFSVDAEAEVEVFTEGADGWTAPECSYVDTDDSVKSNGQLNENGCLKCVVDQDAEGKLKNRCALSIRDAVCKHKGVEVGVVIKNCKECEQGPDGHYRCAALKCADSVKMKKAGQKDAYVVAYARKPSTGMCVPSPPTARCREHFQWKADKLNRVLLDTVQCLECDDKDDVIQRELGVCMPCPADCPGQCEWSTVKNALVCNKCAPGEAFSVEKGNCVREEEFCDPQGKNGKDPEGECSMCQRYDLTGGKSKGNPEYVCLDPKPLKDGDVVLEKDCKKWLSKYEMIDIKNGKGSCKLKDREVFELELQNRRAGEKTVGKFESIGNAVKRFFGGTTCTVIENRNSGRTDKMFQASDNKCYNCPSACPKDSKCVEYKDRTQAKAKGSFPIQVTCEARSDAKDDNAVSTERSSCKEVEAFDGWHCVREADETRKGMNPFGKGNTWYKLKCTFMPKGPKEGCAWPEGFLTGPSSSSFLQSDAAAEVEDM